MSRPIVQPGLRRGGVPACRAQLTCFGARTLMSNAAGNRNLVWRVSCSELLAPWKRREFSSPSPRPDRKSENRKPKEGRNPKSEGRTLAAGSRRRRRAREQPSCKRVGSGPHRSCPLFHRSIEREFDLTFSFHNRAAADHRSCARCFRVSGFGSPLRRAMTNCDASTFAATGTLSFGERVG